MNIREIKRGVCIDGFKAAGVRKGKYGVALIVSEKVCASAGVYTKNNIKAAPVSVTRKLVKNGLQAVVVNSGNANACVKDGVKDARSMTKLAAKAINVKPSNVGVASTGIIGKRLDMKLIGSLIEMASRRLSAGSKASLNAAKAIMTTDTKPKQVSVEFNDVRIGGICKGAGMIAPDMATMLCFMTTNADLNGKQLQSALRKSVNKSFNMTVVDGDMSTNDMVLLLSSQKKKCGVKTFQEMLDYVTLKLAKMIVMDGEGASKYIEVEVKGAKSDGSAVKAARAIVSSPLVKTAFHGENPNWGRIMSTVGSRIKVNPMKATIRLKSRKGQVNVFNQGVVGDLKKAESILKEKEVKVTVNLRLGGGKASTYGCDLSKDYVKINASYN